MESGEHEFSIRVLRFCPCYRRLLIRTSLQMPGGMSVAAKNERLSHPQRVFSGNQSAQEAKRIRVGRFQSRVSERLSSK